jgi:hypothetical protein
VRERGVHLHAHYLDVLALVVPGASELVVPDALEHRHRAATEILMVPRRALQWP